MAGIKDSKKVETKFENGIELRKCNSCNEWLTKSNFYSNYKNNPNWIDSICIDCRKTKSLKRQIEKKDYIKDLNRKKKISKRGYQSPFNYMGNKYLILNEIRKLFPKNINTFVDLFCGSATIGINIEADQVICNDINYDIINFFNNCKGKNPIDI